jgi:hypothetical protein
MAAFTLKQKMEGYHTIGRAPLVVLKQILPLSQLIMMLNMAALEGKELMEPTPRSLMASEASKQWHNQRMNLTSKHLRLRPCLGINKNKECILLEILLDIMDRVQQTQVLNNTLHSI